MGLSSAAQALQNLLSSTWGYISGVDLGGWCDPQLLMTAEAKVPTTLRRAVNQAVSEVQSALQNRYDLTTELLKVDLIPPVATTSIAAGAVSGTKIVLPGSGLTAPPGVTVVNDPDDTTGTGATVTSGVSQGYVYLIHLLSCGRGFRQAPVVNIIGGGGSGATAIATLNGWGGVAAITITNGGNGYTSTPTIEIVNVDGFGFGANAVASINLGKLVTLNITNGGSGYTLPPSLLFDMSAQLPDTRNPKLVKIISIYSVRNIMGQAANVSEMTQGFFKMADTMIYDIKTGADSIPLYTAAREVRSSIEIIQDRFHTLG